MLAIVRGGWGGPLNVHPRCTVSLDEGPLLAVETAVRTQLHENGRQVQQRRAAGVQIDHEVDIAHQHFLDEMSDHQSHTAARITGKQPVEIAPIYGRGAKTGAGRRVVCHRQDHELTPDVIHRDAASKTT